MSEQFWIGLAVTPIIVAVYAALGWLVLALRRAWRAIDNVFIERIALGKRVSIFGKDENPYEWAANKVRDALLQTPKMFTLRGFGWWVVIVRDGKRPDPEPLTQPRDS